ncbi:MAG: Ig-like domain-containing protein, partial [Treponema sp.]|nr:Ig-like domain-containing protein [Treponema sp.]
MYHCPPPPLPGGPPRAKTPRLSIAASAAFLCLSLLFAACDNPAGNGKTVPVTGVSLGPKTLTLAVGGSAALTAAVSPEDASNKAVTWASSDDAVATVDKDGNVTGVAVGTATVTSTTEDGGKTDTCAVTVSAGAVVTGVSLSPTVLTLGVGQARTLTLTVSPADAANKAVTWASSDDAVATVDKDGKVTGAAVGTATVIVTTADGGYTAACAVTVQEEAVTITVDGVSLGSKTLTLAVGGSGALTAVVTPPEAANKAVTWASSDDAVATVTNGVVTGVAAGTATITVTTAEGGKTDTCAVTVQAEDAPVAVTGVSLSAATLTLGVGQEQTLTAAVSPAEAANKAVTWISSDTAIATVDANGKVSGVTAGTATITVTTTDGGKTAACAVTVQAEAVIIAVTGVSLSSATLTVPVGGVGSLTATVSPADAANKAVTWSSGDDAVATVTNGVVTGVATGTATITVTTTDGGHTAACTVTVKGIADYLTADSRGASATDPVP